jgi:hypothetical protein
LGCLALHRAFFGASSSYKPYPASPVLPAVPIAVTGTTLLCMIEVEHYLLCAHPGTVLASYLSLDLAADSNVNIADGAQMTVQLGGADYEVRVQATSVGPGSKDFYGTDYEPDQDSRIAIDVRAVQLEPLIQSLGHE